MNNIQYFKSAWGDIKNSPGWFGKMCLLALILFIPVFGPIVLYGYLYGWAREIAWGTHEPMPERIFANEDGKLYRRGWFIFVLIFVASLIPSIVSQIGNSMQGVGFYGTASSAQAAANSVMVGFGGVVSLIGLLGSLFLGILAWIGSMRISIYDRLSAGFQIGKIWSMFRHDTNGIMRIFGMNLLVSLIIGIIVGIVITFVVVLIVLAGVAGLASSGYNLSSVQHMSDYESMVMMAHIVGSAGIVGFIGVLLCVYLMLVCTVFLEMLVARAMGYWTLQFDVPHWRGQDDPMPFEERAAAGVPPMNSAASTPGGQATYGYQQQPYQQTYQPNYQQQTYQQQTYQQPYGQQAYQQQPYQQQAAQQPQQTYQSAVTAAAPQVIDPVDPPTYQQPATTQQVIDPIEQPTYPSVTATGQASDPFAPQSDMAAQQAVDPFASQAEAASQQFADSAGASAAPESEDASNQG